MSILRMLALLALLGGVTSPAVFGGEAQPKFHALIVTDTAPWAQWGDLAPNVDMDGTAIFAMLTNNIPERQLELIPLSAWDNQGSHPDLILQTLREVNCGPDDVLIVYFSGHGGNDDRGHYLQFFGGKLYREVLRKAMQARGARLNVLVTDCCNSRSDGEKFFAAAPQLEPPDQISPLFRGLFLGHRGWVDVNSSSPGQASFFVPDNDKPGRFPGSIFTSALTGWFDRHAQETLNWDRLLRDVGMTTHVMFRDYYPRGARVAKGAPAQSDQSVYAYTYPGMPDRSGPRAGITVRDAPDGGALVVRVAEASPANELYVLSLQRFAKLEAGDVIAAIQGQNIQDAQSFVDTIRDAPQVVRMKVVEADGKSHEVLMRMKF